jgi:hypothetical protein
MQAKRRNDPVKTKRSWTCSEIRDALKAKFACDLASGEGISEREVRGHIGALSLDRLTDIYFNVLVRTSSDPDEALGLPAIMDEVELSGILPKLAAVVENRRLRS